MSLTFDELELISSHLDIKDLAAFAQVSKTFHAIADHRLRDAKAEKTKRVRSVMIAAAKRVIRAMDSFQPPLLNVEETLVLFDMVHAKPVRAWLACLVFDTATYLHTRGWLERHAAIRPSANLHQRMKLSMGRSNPRFRLLQTQLFGGDLKDQWAPTGPAKTSRRS